MGGHEQDYLSQIDAIMWMVEADPLLRSTILAVAVLDHAPAWLDLVIVPVLTVMDPAREPAVPYA